MMAFLVCFALVIFGTGTIAIIYYTWRFISAMDFLEVDWIHYFDECHIPAERVKYCGELYRGKLESIRWKVSRFVERNLQLMRECIGEEAFVEQEKHVNQFKKIFWREDARISFLPERILIWKGGLAFVRRMATVIVECGALEEYRFETGGQMSTDLFRDLLRLERARILLK